MTTAAIATDSRAYLRSIITVALASRYQMAEDIAACMAADLASAVMDYAGGASIYVPKPEKSQRDADIRREYNGHNMHEIMRRHGVSKRRVYQIVRGG